jgi:hypothetical protein
VRFGVFAIMRVCSPRRWLRRLGNTTTALWLRKCDAELALEGSASILSNMQI